MWGIMRVQRHLPGREHRGHQKRKQRQRKYQRLRAKQRKASSVLNEGDTGTEHCNSGDIIM